MTIELDEFLDWINCKDRNMTRWVSNYFIKKGIPRRLISIEEINTYSSEQGVFEQGVLEQAKNYFSSIRHQNSSEEKLPKMKQSWAQYCRRKKGIKRSHPVYVDDSTHKVLASIKKEHGLDNLGQSVGLIIEGILHRRKILRLEKDKASLNRQLNNFDLLKTKTQQKEEQLEEIRNKISSLEERNLMLTKALEQLSILLKHQ
ncbi:hypothetical protein EBI01_03995 [Marinomonas rhizomae]|uniref:Uncharacterized protein n=1 Tax=Marinomonas rhizomae TaxID=491948 RepID=A0A366JCI2_9GAMM|nr:hypothetical protein [Marinomonas rhizomae]RBP84701.1 hypothetical protein DFP80_103174 [Marinomonas rhizomae]RNF75097.1 hypothetical protein EBI01_03995 [Marinomonas rhizomae]